MQLQRQVMRLGRKPPYTGYDMNHVTAVVSFAAVLVGGSACATGPSPLSDAHREAIRDSVGAVIAQFERYSSAAQWDSLAGLYSSSADFRFLESGAIQYTFRAAIRSALKQVPAGSHITTTHRDLHVDPVAPRVAIATALFETVFADSTGPQFQFGGAADPALGA